MPIPTFYWMNLIIPLLVLIPNVLWMIYPSVSQPENDVEEPLWMTVCENFGRVGVFVFPLFYPVILTDPENRLYLNAMLLLMAFYYACWNRYFRGGRDYRYLYLPMLRIPIPLAISPVLYFVSAAGLLKSFPMLIAAVLLTVGHLPISYMKYRRIKHSP